MGLWGECLSGCFQSALPPPCKAAKRFTHPGCFGYWDFVSRRDGYYYNFLPDYTCDESTLWCGTGQPPPTAESCPAITFSLELKYKVQGFLDDLFVGGASSSAAASAASASSCAPSQQRKAQLVEADQRL